MESRNSALGPVKPSDCALAVTIPLTRERFLTELTCPQEKDFVHHFAGGKGIQNLPPEFCWETYEDEEVVWVKAVCNEAERQGVTVCYDAGLADLTDLLGQFSVVTTVNHWRFVTVQPEDILDPRTLLGLLQSPQTAERQSIRQVFEKRDPQLLRPDIAARFDGEELQGRVAAVIRDNAETAERLYWDAEADEQFKLEEMPDGLRYRLTRWEFEQAFPDCIVPARSIEFSDGMFTVPEVINAVPPDFSGLLDLTVCNSVILAGPLRRQRPCCLVAANRKPAQLRARMYLYGLEISLLAKQPQPFIEVIKQVHAGKPAYTVKGETLWNRFGRFFGSMQGSR